MKLKQAYDDARHAESGRPLALNVAECGRPTASRASHEHSTCSGRPWARCGPTSSAECVLMPLCKAGAGEKVKVACINGERGLCARMAALGIYPGVEMHLLCAGCVRVNGGVLSLGKDVSDKILVTPSP